MLTKERITELAGMFRRMYEFARDEPVRRYVELTDNEYPFDLGDFGERRRSVTLSDDDYRFDAADILDAFPIDSGKFEDLAAEFTSLADEQPAENGSMLESAFAQLREEGKAALATALEAVVAAFNVAVVAAIPLPPKPLPWPGAMRTDIDYTAEDFPLRYQPPPGYDWQKKGPYSTKPLPYTEVVAYTPDEVKTGDAIMIMDAKGRVSWRDRADDDLADGIRWPVWFRERDGIPKAEGNFNGATRPLPLDADGNAIGDWRNNRGSDTPWSGGNKPKALARIKAIKEEFASAAITVPQVGPPVNEYGVTYDPLTVKIAAQGVNSRSRTEDLRVGDFVYAYGRVLKVERVPGSDQFDMTYFVKASNRRRIERRASYNWSIRAMTLDRDNQPTALSISEKNTGAPTAPLGYDPLTVPVATTSEYVATSELRLGDDITGDDFGRVISIDPADLKITMNRDGTINTYTLGAGRIDTEWDVLPIVVDDRDKVPTALALARGETADSKKTVDYDPLTVETAPEEYGVRTDELRLGDDVTGGFFGRVTKMEQKEGSSEITVTLNRDGTENIKQWLPGNTWNVKKIALPDRESYPTALSLAQTEVPIPF